MTDTPTKAPREHVSAQVVIPVVIIILGSALGNLSQTAMNAMFGGIAADFKVDMALGQWVTTLYMLVIGITVPVVTYLYAALRAQKAHHLLSLPFCFRLHR